MCNSGNGYWRTTMEHTAIFKSLGSPPQGRMTLCRTMYLHVNYTYAVKTCLFVVAYAYTYGSETRFCNFVIHFYEVMPLFQLARLS